MGVVDVKFMDVLNFVSSAEFYLCVTYFSQAVTGYESTIDKSLGG